MAFVPVFPVSQSTLVSPTGNVYKGWCLIITYFLIWQVLLILFKFLMQWHKLTAS